MITAPVWVSWDACTTVFGTVNAECHCCVHSRSDLVDFYVRRTFTHVYAMVHKSRWCRDVEVMCSHVALDNGSLSIEGQATEFCTWLLVFNQVKYLPWHLVSKSHTNSSTHSRCLVCVLFCCVSVVCLFCSMQHSFTAGLNTAETLIWWPLCPWVPALVLT